MNKARRVLVLGLDGGTWSIFDRFIEAGAMPNLQRLCAEGYRAPLMSTIPAVTPTAWTSFATGMNPGTHGIYGFTAPRMASESYAAPIARSDMVEQPTIWQRLSNMGLQSIVLCVPLTYPAKPLNGSLVTGMFTPGLDSRCTYPASLKQELLANDCMPRFEMNVLQGQTGVEANPLRESLKNNGARFFEDLADITDRLHKTVQYLMNRPWDFFMAVFVGTDRIQHALYDRIASTRLDSSDIWSQRIRDFYSHIDSVIGDIRAEVGDDTICMLMSDHGFGPCRGRYYLGRWLVNSGYARYQSRRMYRFTKKLLEMTHLKRLMFRHLSNKTKSRIVSSSYPFDWTQSRGFFTDGDGIRINLRGREKKGIVEPGLEYEALRKELRERLLEVRDGDYNKRVISRAWFAEELYRGECLPWAPDIILEPSDEASYVLARGSVNSSKLSERIECYTGSHRRQGIFVAHGPGIVRNNDGKPSQIIDVAPTILYQLGLPVPDDMEGRIIKDIFESEPIKRVVQTVSGDNALADPEQTSKTQIQRSDDEDEEVKRRLKNLGYLE